MFNNTEIHLLINESYSLFSTYSFGNIVAVHSGNCCLSHEDAELLKTIPLHNIDQRLIYEYLNACEEHDQCSVVIQIKYLLPKILELLAENKHIHHSTECILDKFHLNLTNVWNEHEIDFMNRFAIHFFKSKILIYDDTDHINSYLIMFHRGGLNIQLLLNEWLNYLNQPNALLNILYILYYHFNNECYQQAFSNEKMIEIMNSWSNTLKNNEDFFNAIIEVLTSDTIYSEYQFMIESVFEKL